MLKNKFLTILIMLLLSSPVFAEPEMQAEPTEPIVPIEQQVLDEDKPVQEVLPEVNSIPYKTPVSKKKIAKKFLLAMGGVAVSSIVLFLLLSLYNRFRESFTGAKTEQNAFEESTLETPDNIVEAVKIFLEKTKWG